MTRSTPDSNADYTPMDMGIPSRLPHPSMWAKHDPTWETKSPEEKRRCVELSLALEKAGIPFDTSVRYYNPLKTRTKEEEADKLDEVALDDLP